MYIFELTKPGVWLDGFADTDEQREVESLLHLLTTCVNDAAVSLWLFESAQGAQAAAEDPAAKWEADRERESRIQATLERELPANLSPEDRFAASVRVRDEARIQARREGWANGEVPRSYVNRVPFVHAKSCLYALDTLHKALKLLSQKASAPSGVRSSLQAFEAAFPSLRDVRNSAHHVEDRIQGKHYDKTISLQPIVNPAISALAGGVLVVDLLSGNRYGGTLADGSFGEVEVSQTSVATATRVAQDVLNSYRWRGPAEQLPY